MILPPFEITESGEPSLVFCKGFTDSFPTSTLPQLFLKTFFLVLKRRRLPLTPRLANYEYDD